MGGCPIGAVQPGAARAVCEASPVTDRLLTARGLADYLGLSASTVLDWFEDGRLPDRSGTTGSGGSGMRGEPGDGSSSDGPGARRLPRVERIDGAGLVRGWAAARSERYNRERRERYARRAR